MTDPEVSIHSTKTATLARVRAAIWRSDDVKVECKRKAKGKRSIYIVTVTHKEIREE